PSRAFQFRFGGAKGVVYAGEESLLCQEGLQYKMLLRDSQVKFEVPDRSRLNLRIASTAGDCHRSLFFPSALRAFEDSGADTNAIEKIYETAYTQLTDVSWSGVQLLQQIFRIPSDVREPTMKARHGLLKLALHLGNIGVTPEQYQDSFLGLYLAKLAEQAKQSDLFAIPIPGSYCLLGLTDDYGILKSADPDPCEVFIRANEKTIEGEVLIYRDPIIHIGDIQKATAIGEAVLRARIKADLRLSRAEIEARIHALVSMDNVIFFSQHDRPPLPHRLSGGDLDGDRFEVLTKECGFWDERYHTSNPANYADDEDKPPLQSDSNDEGFNISRLADFVGHFVQNHCFDDLQDVLMCLADEREGGLNHDDTKDLARWLSKAVDYAKNGEVVDLTKDVLKNSRFRPTRIPDFLCALNRKAYYDPEERYYESSSLLGKLYRANRGKQYKIPNRTKNLGLLLIPDLDPTRFIKPVLPATMSLFRLEDVIDKIVEGHAHQYRQYCLQQRLDNVTSISHQFERATTYGNYKLSEISEVQLFLRDQDDDFPNHFVQQLIMEVRDYLLNNDNISHTWLDSPTTGKRILLHEPKFVRDIYKWCLRKAWYKAIQQGEAYWTQGYAFICLYALFCATVPFPLQDSFVGTHGVGPPNPGHAA
ncbi:hypothetical protein MMC07_001661, partial [Pseudocyphellaria aurata]|nr:hypothetical protein [Pseudocyphellaria aurata]